MEKEKQWTGVWVGGLMEVKAALYLYVCYSIVTLECINSYKLVNIKNIKVMNQTKPVLLSQPHLER